MKKKTFDVIFIFFVAAMLILLNTFYFENSVLAYTLLPLMAAYYIGQFSQRKFEKKKGKVNLLL